MKEKFKGKSPKKAKRQGNLAVKEETFFTGPCLVRKKEYKKRRVSILSLSVLGSQLWVNDGLVLENRSGIWSIHMEIGLGGFVLCYLRLSKNLLF
jgi:hypothetical protein